ncbi:autotransporter-associated beta strand repeat-containing protein, partial [Sandarakinorhabdus sp.]|uniref:beta strand repeat-containing protein n=1 Tax=Sandarakinorhabdus sp. TaxID=1916663 RepID=UPI003340707F
TGTVAMADGTQLATAGGTFTVGNAVTITGSASLLTQGAGDVLTLSGIIADGSGAGAIAKNGPGTVTLTGTNSYTGGTNINAGTLAIDDGAAIGSGAIALADGTTLRAGIGGDQAITLTNAVSVATGTGNIALNGGFTVDTAGTATISGTQLTVSGPATGAGTLSFRGGSATLANTSGFTGSVALRDAVLNLVDATSLGNGTLLITDAGGIANNSGSALSFANTVDAVGAAFVVIGANDVSLSGVTTADALFKAGPGTLTLGNGSNAFNFVQLGSGTLAVAANGALGAGIVQVLGSGTLRAAAADLSFGNSFEIFIGDLTVDTQAFTLTLSGDKSDAGGLIKIGTGTLILGGTNSYAGDTNVNVGTLDLQGSISGNVNVAAGAAIVGTGSAAGTVTFANDAIVGPGNSPGTLNFGSLVLNDTTALNFELAGLAAVPGTGADLIVVTNDLTLNGVLNITGLPGFNVGVGNRTIITYGNLLANNDLTVATAPPVDVTYSILAGPVASGAGIVQLNLAFTGTYRWDGTDLAPDGTIDGGNGIFNLTNTNFTNSNGTFNLAYGNNATDDIEFGGAVGSVDVASVINFDQMSFVTAGYTLGGLGALNVNNSVINVVNGVATVGVGISGVNGLTKGGAGELIVTTVNTYSGGTNVTGGVLTLAANFATGSGMVNLANGTTLRSVNATPVIEHFNAVAITGSATFDVTGSLFTQNAVISGGALVKTGTGQLQLTTNNTYNGGTDVQVGSFGATQNGSLGTGAVTMADTTFGNFSGGLTVANNFTLTSGIVQLGVGIGSTTLNGTVAGGANLEKFGVGRLELGNAGNSYSGGTNITAGTVAVATDGALGSGNIRFSAVPGALETLGSFSTAKTVTLDAAGTINTNANTNRFDGVIAGANSLTKTGAGTLILTGTNGYAATLLNAGTLQIDDGAAIGAGVLTTTAGTTLIAGLAINTPALTLANNIVLGAGGNTTINLLGSNYGVNVTTGALTTNGTALVLDGVISGDGGIDTLGFLANGAGSIAFNSTNSFTGGVNLGSVIAYANANNALGTGTVNLNAFGAGIQNTNVGTTRSLVNAVNVNDFQHSVGGAGNLVLSGAVGGNGQLFKVNDGTVTFTGAGSSYGGNFAINDGTVLVNGSFVNAAATYVVAGGARIGGTGSIAGSVTVANGADLNPGIASGPGTLTIGNLSLDAFTNVNFDLGAANTIGGLLNDRVIVTGNLVLDGLLNVSETVGGSFGLGIYNLFSYGTLTDNGLTINGLLPNALTGTVQHNATAQQINLVVAGPGSVVLNWDGTDFTGQAPGAPLGQGGNGVWSTTNTNWAGNAPGEVNATWQPNAVGIFGGTAGTVDVASPFAFAGLGFQADGYTLANAGGSLTTNAVTGSFISVDAALTATINATIAGTGVLMKQGAGTLVLGGNNTLTGNVNLNNGTLAVTSDAALGLGSLVFTGGTTLRADAGVSLANAMTLNGQSNIDSNGNTVTLGGVLSGPGVLIKQGAGSLVLNGANGYAGGTTVEAGSVVVGNNLALGTGDAFFNDATSLVAGINGRTIANNIFLINTVNIDTQAFDLTLSGVIGGTGPLTKLGTGNLILNGNNVYAGGSILLDGTVTLGTSSALGSGQVDVNGQVVLLSGAADLNIGNAVVLNDVGTFDVATFTTTYSGVISGAQALNKVGSGNLILTNANLNSGGVTLDEGRLTVADDAALGTGALTMAGGTTLASGAAGLVLANAITTNGLGTVDTAGNIFTLDGVIDGAGSVTKIGSGNLVLNAGNSFSGGSFINVGTVTVGNNAALGTALVTMANGT